jgi:hypothetical protein
MIQRTRAPVLAPLLGEPSHRAFAADAADDQAPTRIVVQIDGALIDGVGVADLLAGVRRGGARWPVAQGWYSAAKDM